MTKAYSRLREALNPAGEKCSSSRFCNKARIPLVKGNINNAGFFMNF